MSNNDGNNERPHYVYEDDAQAVEIIKKHLNGHALRPPKTDAPKRLISARLSVNAHIGLQRVAAQLGYTHANQGNVSLLLEAIGTGMVVVTPTELIPRRL